MSQTTKLVLGIAVAVIVLGGGYAYWQNSMESTTPTSTEEVTSLPSGTDTTDQALDSDITAVDAQLKAVGTDNAGVTTSISIIFYT